MWAYNFLTSVSSDHILLEMTTYIWSRKELMTVSIWKEDMNLKETEKYHMGVWDDLEGVN